MTKTKIIVFGLFAFGAGVATGYYICKQRLEAYYNQEIEDYIDYLDERYGVNDAEDEPEEDEEEPEEDEEEPEEDEEIIVAKKTVNKLINTELYSPEKKGKPRINYNKPSMTEMVQRIQEEEAEPEEIEKDEDYEAEIEAAAEAEALNRFQAESNGEPYLISYEEYVDGVEDYEAQSLYFYTHDGVLCEDDDTPVQDPTALVGYDFERKLEMQTSAFVRNDAVMVLYEIHRIQRSYEKDVLGVSETPREREMRLNSRRKAAKDGE